MNIVYSNRQRRCRSTNTHEDGTFLETLYPAAAVEDVHDCQEITFKNKSGKNTIPVDHVVNGY